MLVLLSLFLVTSSTWNLNECYSKSQIHVVKLKINNSHMPMREASEETGPANNLISDFYPPEPWEHNFYCLSCQAVVFCYAAPGNQYTDYLFLSKNISKALQLSAMALRGAQGHSGDTRANRQVTSEEGTLWKRVEVNLQLLKVDSHQEANNKCLKCAIKCTQGGFSTYSGSKIRWGF